MKIKIKGIRERESCSLYLNGKKVKHDIYHSPTGMNWGYGGSGPADAARSILVTIFPRNIALRLYQFFKWDHVSKWNFKEVDVEVDLKKWLGEVLDKTKHDWVFNEYVIKAAEYLKKKEEKRRRNV